MADAEPLPSSTLILLRAEPVAADPFAVLMLERHGSVTFPGVHAFPGGVVDPGDHVVPGARLPPDQAWAPAGEGDGPDDALPYWVAAVRELFEEVGILLSTRAGAPVASCDLPDLADLRARLHAGAPFAELLAEHDLTPATDALYYLARWITPKQNPRRFDTRFLVARLPDVQEACADGTETVSCRWFGPREALAAYESGAITLIPPTVRTLDDLARFPSIDAVLADARRRVVRAVRPQVVTVGGQPALQYPDEAGHAELPPRRLVLRDGRWRPAD
ncbi:MAG: NUDIX hydrolase [bacterium]|nr:NUDIX hydrolase [bacterium]